MKSILLKIMYYILGALNKLLTYEAIKKTEQFPRKFKKTGHNCKFSPQSFFRGEEYISIGDSFKSGIHFRLEAFKEYNQQHFFPSIEIGDNVSIQDFCHIGCIAKIVVGSGTMIASRVYISDHNHGNITSDDVGTPPEKRPLSSSPIYIGNNVWIGEGSCILPGVSLGNNVIVGANAVVTHSFPENCVIAGVPAKIIKRL
jgi:acetyltransferase-like isoleucine patch superfamily enzyme